MDWLVVMIKSEKAHIHQAWSPLSNGEEGYEKQFWMYGGAKSEADNEGSDHAPNVYGQLSLTIILSFMVGFLKAIKHLQTK